MPRTLVDDLKGNRLSRSWRATCWRWVARTEWRNNEQHACSREWETINSSTLGTRVCTREREREREVGNSLVSFDERSLLVTNRNQPSVQGLSCRCNKLLTRPFKLTFVRGPGFRIRVKDHHALFVTNFHSHRVHNYAI